MEEFHRALQSYGWSWRAIGLSEFAIGFAAVAMLAWAFLRRWAVRSTEPRCGNCNYALTGTTSLICSECGMDLRQAGIIPPARRRPLKVAGRTIVWCAAYILLLPSLLMLWERMVPQEINARNYIRFEQPPSADYRSIALDLHYHSTQFIGRTG